MLNEVAVLCQDSPYFAEWATATLNALQGRFPIVRSTTDLTVDIGSPTLFLIIGDVNVGTIPQQIRRQMLERRPRRARVVLWYTERLPLVGTSCPEADARWWEFKEVCDVYDVVLGVDAGMVEFMRQQGIEAHHTPVGFDPIFDARLPRLPATSDVLFQGEVNARRGRILQDVELAGLSVTRGFAQWGMARAYAMARAGCYLNLHYDDYPMFEELRFLIGMANGVPMVSETIQQCAPFVAGEHFIMAEPEDVPEAVLALRDSGWGIDMAERASEFVRNELTMRSVMDAALRQMGMWV